MRAFRLPGRRCLTLGALLLVLLVSALAAVSAAAAPRRAGAAKGVLRMVVLADSSADGPPCGPMTLATLTPRILAWRVFSRGQALILITRSISCAVARARPLDGEGHGQERPIGLGTGMPP
jgi:hypothetical protein